MKNKIHSLGLAVLLALPVMTGAVLVGCAGNQYDRSTGEYIDDKGMNHRVKSALGDNPEYKFDDVNVDTFRGTVQLSGYVNTADQKRKAGDIAEHVQGVKKVENNITIKD